MDVHFTCREMPSACGTGIPAARRVSLPAAEYTKSGTAICNKTMKKSP